MRFVPKAALPESSPGLWDRPHVRATDEGCVQFLQRQQPMGPAAVSGKFAARHRTTGPVGRPTPARHLAKQRAPKQSTCWFLVRRSLPLRKVGLASPASTLAFAPTRWGETFAPYVWRKCSAPSCWGGTFAPYAPLAHAQAGRIEARFRPAAEQHLNFRSALRCVQTLRLAPR